VPIVCTGATEMDSWIPPGKDCGACGSRTCEDFTRLVLEGAKTRDDCPFSCESRSNTDANFTGLISQHALDIVGRRADFILEPIPGEPSPRKSILPFRPDLVSEWKINRGDLVVGRPAGSGCPVQHVLEVLEANPVTGVLICHTVGPLALRGRKHHDVEAYHVIGFEGRAAVTSREPVFGLRQPFMPSACMMNLCHTGVVNMILHKSWGLHIRIEDIRI
jgi:uncharacterized Fe-S cluster-containing protein